MLIILFLWVATAQEFKKTEWPAKTPVIMLNCDNFDRYTKLGWESVEQPWFVFFWTVNCPACPRMVPIWETLTRNFKDDVNMAALDGYIVIKKKR